MNLKFDCKHAAVEADGGSGVRVFLTEIDLYDLEHQAKEILENIENETILEEVNDAEMIDHIGIETISEYVDLEEFFDHNEEDVIALMKSKGFMVERKHEEDTDN